MKPPEEVTVTTASSPSSRQRPQHGALGLDALAVAGVAPADQLIDEAAIVGDRVEVARAPHEKRVLNCELHVTAGPLDRAVLMRDTAIVAAGDHAVVATERILQPGGQRHEALAS
jgi:hypothetical protein